jgi:DNA-binding transcriptional LysR family regulator
MGPLPRPRHRAMLDRLSLSPEIGSQDGWETPDVDKLQSLRMFAEAVRANSLSAAARKLGISTATVSRSIDALEENLGFSLLVKNSRQLGLTEAGSAYLPRVERLLQELDEATEFARGFQAEAQGTLRVHARTAVGTICIAPLLPQFLKQYPRVRIYLTLSNDTNLDLIKNNIDIDIRSGVLADSSLICKRLASSHRLIVASPRYLQQRGIPQTPEELTNHNCITYHPEGAGVIWRFRNAEGKEIEIAPYGNLETDSGAVIRTNLLAGVGIGHMTDWSVAEDLRSGRLVHLFPDHLVTVDQFNHGIYAVFLPSRDHSNKVRAFLDFLTDAFRSQAFLSSPTLVE